MSIEQILKNHRHEVLTDKAIRKINEEIKNNARINIRM